MSLMCVVLPQKCIFCGTNFVSTIALDLQHKLKTCLHSSHKQIAMRAFHGFYSSYVYLRNIFVNFRDF